MVDATQVREHMAVVGSDGAHVGTVDKVEGDRIKLTRSDASDGQHHYIPLSSMARVDSSVHLTMTGAAALGGDHGGEAPLPPVKNRAVDGARARSNFYLPWIVGIVGVILLLLLLKSCFHHNTETAAVAPVTDIAAPAAAPSTPAALPVESVGLPNGKTVDLEPKTFNYELQRYLASSDPTPRTFQFDKLNFDTNSATIRDVDHPNIDALAQVLAAYSKAKVKIIGYTDARGPASANDQLGKQRADAVVAALTGKGVAKGQAEAVSGGEADPTDTNATAQGQFENRRTELTVLAK